MASEQEADPASFANSRTAVTYLLAQKQQQLYCLGSEYSGTSSPQPISGKTPLHMAKKDRRFKITNASDSGKKQFTSLFGRPSCKRQNSIRLVKRYTRLIK